MLGNWQQYELSGMTDGEGRLARFPFPLSGVCPATLSGLEGDDVAWVQGIPAMDWAPKGIQEPNIVPKNWSR